MEIKFNGNDSRINPTNAGIKPMKKGTPNIIAYFLSIWQCNLPFKEHFSHYIGKHCRTGKKKRD